MSERPRTLPLFCLTGLLAAAAAGAQPTITALNQDTLARSGRLALTGSGFGVDGNAGGRVLVDGLEAWVSTWTDERVVAYVPETAALGATEVVVELDGQTSNAMPLTVTTRASDGRVKWLFEIDSEYIYYRPGLAPDGTLYLHGYSWESGGEGRVYAIAPDGALKWITEVNWAAYVPPIAGPDGAVYVGSGDTLTRIGPDGVIDWTFDSHTIQGSAAIGPDGTVYAGFEQIVEVVALDPLTGELLWSLTPGLSAFGTGGNEIRIGNSAPGGPDDRFYIYWDGLYGISMDGEYLFENGLSNVYDHEPAIGSDGTLYLPAGFESGLAAVSPFDGQVQWFVDEPWLAGISDVEIGPDDTLYFVSDGRWVDAFDPVSRSSIWRHNTELSLRRPSLTPDGSLLLTSGGGNCDSSGCHISFIKAFETGGGNLAWHLDLDPVWDPEFRRVTYDHARITPDSRTAYFTGWLAGGEDYLDERSYLWAIELQDAAIFADGFESGDTAAWSSVVE